MKHGMAFLLIGFTLCALTTLSARGADAPDKVFFFRDGDCVVAIGDSLTVQGDYGRYLENFIRTRFPKWKVIFRNCGINGHTAQMGLPYLEDDVFVWKPNLAIVNWGMNDGRRQDGVDYYKTGIVPYVEKLLAAKVRVVLCSNAPLDIGDAPGKFTDFNRNFDEMAKFAEMIAKERNIAFVDQFHFCHTLWGENRLRTNPVPVSDQTLARHPSDSVHARAPGQLTFTCLLLKTLNAPGEVSFAAIDAASGKAETRRCQISEFKKEENVITFVRADEASPCYIDDVGAKAFDLVPFQDEFNRMILQVKNLPAGEYALKVDDFIHGRFTARQLAEGVNLSLNRQSPVYEPGRQVDGAIRTQMGATYGPRENMRWQPPAWLKIPDLDRQKQAQFTALLPQFAKNDAALAAAAAPKAHRYEIRPVK